MSNLAIQACSVCRTNSVPIERSESVRLLLDILGWSLIEEQGVVRLRKIYAFKNFTEAVEFSNRIAEIAEAADHHPAILIEWGQATVSWWTHSIKGLHLNDFIMAARTDLLIE